MIRLVLLGLPGSGKSTQSAMLGSYYGLPVISAGALLREAVKQGTDLGRQVQEYLQRGELAPNHLVDLLVFGELRRPGSGRGFVLDGFPRTLDQARSLDEFMRKFGWWLSRVIYLEVPEVAIIARLSARRVCPVCGAIYSLSNAPRPGEICYACNTPLRYPARETIECEACGVHFALRQDDRPEVLRRRLQIQKRVLWEVVAHYGNLGLLAEVNGDRIPEEVFDEIRALLSGRRQVGEN